MATSPTTVYAAGMLIPQLDGTYEILFGEDGSDNSLITTDTLTFGGSAGVGGSISFNETDTSVEAGVARGYTDNSWAPSKNGTNDATNSITNDYLVAEPNNDVTISFNDTQEYFGLLWGSMNDGNTLSFYNGTTLVATISYDGTNLVTTIESGSDAGTYSVAEDNDSTHYVSVSISAGFTSVVASSDTGGFEFANLTYATATPSGTSGTPSPVTPYDGSTPLCFLEGTLLATPTGTRAVETLRPGDLVLTAAGQAKPVRWMGVRKVASRFTDKLKSYPVRVAAGALEEGLPVRDLLLSPEHALLVDGLLINAAALVNGANITREATMPAVFTYYHVELDEHDLILAEGVAAETFLDHASRANFDNWKTHPDQGQMAEMELPRAKAARQVPERLRARLLARAAGGRGRQAA
ncbi:Hint domain-containing protein [Acidocella sp.]|uniref:Hint domain-containing protein n=1 Tax=Acidocella sp. TaxID=50710 RepID=UPI003CFC5A64